ncbi:hypothetical protein HanIR_Chr05g0246461 [Helianthus annuus]|nr:hypothetical protein HanIR_Chr05g0246461 [Helianthus annuus]
MNHRNGILHQIPVPVTARGRKRVGDGSQTYPDIGDFYKIIPNIGYFQNKVSGTFPKIFRVLTLLTSKYVSWPFIIICYVGLL